MSYSKEVKLQDNEIPAKINVETGEVVPVKSRTNNIPEGKHVYNPKGEFYKGYIKADEILIKLLTPMEYRVVAIMRNKSRMNTNSLEPLSDESSIHQIAETLDVHRNSVHKIINRLRDLGIFASFEVTNQYKQRIKCWILNPCISFKGKTISDEIVGLFYDTMITKLIRE